MEVDQLRSKNVKNPWEFNKNNHGELASNNGISPIQIDLARMGTGLARNQCLDQGRTNKNNNVPVAKETKNSMSIQKTICRFEDIRSRYISQRSRNPMSLRWAQIQPVGWSSSQQSGHGNLWSFIDHTVLPNPIRVWYHVNSYYDILSITNPSGGFCMCVEKPLELTLCACALHYAEIDNVGPCLPG